MKKKTESPKPRPSLAERVARLRGALGDPFGEHPSLGHYATALDGADSASRSKAAPKPDFLARADAFLAAREIALELVGRRAQRDDWENVTHRAAALFDVESIGRGHVRTLSQLKYLETAFFTEWNESPLSHSGPFWRAIDEAGLPFVRRDLLGEILERGRITSREHYEHAVDMLGLGESAGVSATDARRLSQMIGAFEAGRTRRP